MLRPYKSCDPDNGVTHYAIGLDRITVWFAGSDKPLTYSFASASAFHVQAMVRLAGAGQGLNDYIGRYVKTRHIRTVRVGVS